MMIAAMAAAVSAPSSFFLVSGCAGLAFGALFAGDAVSDGLVACVVGLVVVAVTGASADVAAKGKGFANSDCATETKAVEGLLAGTS
jgi:hypothetical protein